MSVHAFQLMGFYGLVQGFRLSRVGVGLNLRGWGFRGRGGRCLAVYGLWASGFCVHGMLKGDAVKFGK